MKAKTNSLVKSMAIGLAVGGATAAVSKMVMGNNTSMKKAKKNAAKAMKTVSGVMDSMASMTNMKF
ncbi:MAG: hypothetical protein IJF40_01855 [Clostridia bacterium]|nr:hypothetical protein [Clostridia bacterium]